MGSLLLTCLLAGLPAEANGAVVAELRSTVQTGTLLFSQGDCLAIKVFSGSSHTHVGAVVVEDGLPVVYDAMNGSGVRRQSLAEYVRFLTPSDVQVLQPARPMTAAESAAFVRHLHGQLGRPYRIKHYTTGKRTDGLHCAEYLTDSLIAAGWFTAKEPARVSPGSLYAGVTQSGKYVVGKRFELTEPATPVPTSDETWCQRSWRETQECTSVCCRQMARWFLCRAK
jgi:hypothetical protein